MIPTIANHHVPPFSSALSRASAFYLCAIGGATLFASRELMDAVVPGVPLALEWLGQMLAGAWLAAAQFNWSGRSTLMGGIYGRPQLSLNLVLFLVSALGLWKTGPTGAAFWILTVPMTAFAGVYAALLVRGPFDRLA